MPDEKDNELPGDDIIDDSSDNNDPDKENIHLEVLDPDGEVNSVELAETANEILDLEKKLLDLRRERNEIYDRLLRKQADFDNFRKRAEKDRKEFQQYALSDFMLELIPVLDNFERALSHSDEQSGSDYRKGVELIYKQLRDALEKKGLKAIETEGQTFDPNFHEAIAREVNDNLPENTILQELQKGYYYRDRLLRPAMVKVSHRSDNPQDNYVHSGNGEDEEPFN